MSFEFTVLPVAPNPFISGEGAAFADDPRLFRWSLALFEQMGVDAVVIDHPGGLLANFDIAEMALQLTSRLRVVLTHWAGVMDPMEAARQIALLSNLGQGRLSLRILPDGDQSGASGQSLLAHSQLWHRTDEYLRILRRLWLNDRPFEYVGPFHHVCGGYLDTKPFDADSIQIWIGGRSGIAFKVIGRHGDIVEVDSGDPAEIDRIVTRIQTTASECGRKGKVRFSLVAKVAAMHGLSLSSSLARCLNDNISGICLRASPDMNDIGRYRREILDLVGDAPTAKSGQVHWLQTASEPVAYGLGRQRSWPLQ